MGWRRAGARATSQSQRETEGGGRGAGRSSGAPARTVVDRELRREQPRASADGLSTSWPREPDGPPTRRAPPAVVAAHVPMSTRAARLPRGATGVHGLVRRRAPALAAGQCVPPRRGHQRAATPRRPGWMLCSVPMRRPACTVPAIHVCPAQRSSGPGS